MGYFKYNTASIIIIQKSYNLEVCYAMGSERLLIETGP